MCVGCGTRLGEALAVGEDDIDLAHGLLHVRRTLLRAGRELVFGPPKTERARRSVLLPDEAVSAIRAALVWKKERRLRLGSRFRDAGLLFCGRTGRPLNPSNIRNRDQLPRLERLHLPHVRLHDLRHAHATYLVAAGVDHAPSLTASAMRARRSRSQPTRTRRQPLSSGLQRLLTSC